MTTSKTLTTGRGTEPRPPSTGNKTVGPSGNLPAGQFSSERLPEPRIQKATDTQVWQQHWGAKDAADVQDGQRPGAHSRAGHLPGRGPAHEARCRFHCLTNPGGTTQGWLRTLPGLRVSPARDTPPHGPHNSPRPTRWNHPRGRRYPTGSGQQTRGTLRTEFRSRARRPGAPESAGLLHPHPAPLTFPSNHREHARDTVTLAADGAARPGPSQGKRAPRAERSAAATRPLSSGRETHLQSQPGSKA